MTPTAAIPNAASSTAAELDAAVAHLSYEEARSELVDIVTRLEQGNIALEESLAMWERGEALARRCSTWLDGARERLAAARHNNADHHSNTDEVGE